MITMNGQPKKICNHCGRLYTDRCDCSGARQARRTSTKQYDKKRTDFYSTPSWRAISRTVRVRDYNQDRLKLYLMYHPLESVSDTLRDIVNTADGHRLVVHHIEPREENRDRQYDMDNLITLDTNVHDYVHEEYCTDRRDAMRALLRKAVEWTL